jgi:hypothetical protein
VQLLAERYGGHGLGGNGGGARCGVIGEIQIKVSAVTSSQRQIRISFILWWCIYKRGCIRVTVGEILNRALPHGGTSYRFSRHRHAGAFGRPLPGQDPTTERALIFRQAAIRPAHFMRSAYHRPPVNSGWCDDTSRTRAAIAALPAVFSALYCLPSMNESSDVFIHRCMSIMLNASRTSLRLHAPSG